MTCRCRRRRCQGRGACARCVLCDVCVSSGMMCSTHASPLHCMPHICTACFTSGLKPDGGAWSVGALELRNSLLVNKAVQGMPDK